MFDITLATTDELAEWLQQTDPTIEQLIDLIIVLTRHIGASDTNSPNRDNNFQCLGYLKRYTLTATK